MMKQLSRALSKAVSEVRSFLETMYGLSAYSEEAFRKEIRHIIQTDDGGEHDGISSGEDDQAPSGTC